MQVGSLPAQALDVVMGTSVDQQSDIFAKAPAKDRKDRAGRGGKPRKKAGKKAERLRREAFEGRTFERSRDVEQGSLDFSNPVHEDEAKPRTAATFELE
jgi:hypothetical protein